MNDSLQMLLSRLSIGPAFLVLGQASTNWRDDESREHLPIPPLGSSSEQYEAVADSLGAEVTPHWLTDLAQFPWNGVFTSRIDPALEKAFAADWRRVVSIGSPQVGRYPRSMTELQVRHLFGGMSLPEDERPPSDPVEEVEARDRAAECLNVLAERLVTPRGVIVIDGYDADDWLSPKELFVFLRRLGAEQAHLFSATPQLLADAFIRTAVERGLVSTHVEPFALVLDEVRSTGRLEKSITGHGVGGQRLIPVGNRFVELDISTWNQVIGTARPVDTNLLEPFGTASPSITYQRLRNMLGSSEGAPPFKAVASGYKLRRDFEYTLQRRVAQGLNELSMPDPIIVSGQTATGKSLALCGLALEVARSGHAAVLHQSRRGDRPTLVDVDAFASWVEATAEVPTLLIWDGMVSDDDYYLLQKQLRSRGRRVLIVGSSYRMPGESSRKVVAEAGLSPGEVKRTRSWLAQFEIEIPARVGAGLDSSFLAILYRLLPDTQYGIRRGLAREARNYEAAFERLAKNSRNAGVRLTALSQALSDAGYDIDTLRPSERPHAELIDLSFSERSAAEQLTAIILVAGQHGLSVPLELVLRMIGREGWSHLVELVAEFDLFRWEENDSGEQTLGVRTTLEAKLLAREDLTVDTEITVVCEMIEALRPSPSRWGGVEVQFIVDLIEKIGPKSPDASRYSRRYLKIATAFKNLREDLGRTHHRLVLQEANLTREYVQWAQRSNLDKQLDHVVMLRETQRLLEGTIEDAEASDRAKLNLLVELASTIGAQVYEHAHSDDESTDSAHIATLMKHVIRSVLAARRLDPENYYPVDVVAWTTSRAVETGDLQGSVKLELLANASASLDSVDSSVLSPSQRARYNNRQIKMAQLLDDPVLESRHLQSLTEIHEPAAYYFLALLEARKGSEGKQTALTSLINAPSEVREDWRCCHLLLDLFWELRTGKRFLKGEREVLAFSTGDWNDCLRIADAISSPNSFDQYRLQFLRGLALFHLGQYKRSEAVFGELDRDSTELSSRVVATYLASTETGEPQLLAGRVTWASPDGRRGKVWVDKLAIDVNFIPRRFQVSDFPQKGDLLPNFHIAFNMRGALAEPVRALRRPDGGQRDAG